MRLVLLLALLAPLAARAETAGPFANHNFDIFFTEMQITDDPERPEIPQNRRTQIQVGIGAASTRISRNWDKPPPALEHLEAAGALGAWVSLQNRGRLRHSVDGKRLTQTVMTASFVARVVIELEDKDCKARIDYALQPGERYFRMRNIALGTPMRVFEIRAQGQPKCRVGEELLW